MKIASVEPVLRTNVEDITLQATSFDIWDKKYRLKRKDGVVVDSSIDATYSRVAKALAGVEKGGVLQAEWAEKFLWALRHGAIPAGRIISNAGAQDYKPATSTINCTVSGVVKDSMNDILNKVHEAGLTLKAGCGIGYEFSTLRPKGAFVAGAGAYTSGPLSFMDIYDKMCFTVSSAGGRRGAQMATFDVGHPDVLDFIRAKREDGRLRQFNLSLLITKEFIEAVKNQGQWKLAYPVTEKEVSLDVIDVHDPEQVVWREWPTQDNYIVNDEGLVACKIYKVIRARRLWDVIMSSTYDYAEPGFILIDKVNEMNNNWFTENIRATNPCVTADTRLHTQFGMLPIGELCAGKKELDVTVDRRALDKESLGTEMRPAVPAFMTAKEADVYLVKTEDGYGIKATRWHDFYTDRGKLKLEELKEGDAIMVQSGKGQFGKQGNRKLGMLIGLIATDGSFSSRGRGKQAAVINFRDQERQLAPEVADYVNSLIANVADSPRQYHVTPIAVPDRNHLFIRSVILARVLAHYGFSGQSKLRVPELIWRGTEECIKGYLQSLFQANGAVDVADDGQWCSVLLASRYSGLLTDVQQLLSNFGIFCRIDKGHDVGKCVLPDGKGGKEKIEYSASYTLSIEADSRDRFMHEIGFLLEYKNDLYHDWAKDRTLEKSQTFTSKINLIRYMGKDTVFDTTQADHNTVIFNGMVTGQCGEQPLPPYGSCLLGSVNLTKFVLDPFTDRSRFDWDKYKKVVGIFTRMLDNVIEINGLPLEGQRDEIFEKRRHGMGYLGLGSTLTMMGIKYGSNESLAFTEKVTQDLAVVGWTVGLELAKEKGPAPIMEKTFTVTAEMLRKRPEMVRDGHKVGDLIKGKILHAEYSRYMQRLAEVQPDLVDELSDVGARFTHHSSIAPTGTISLSLANNASNGIEPSFAHHYSRNVIREGRKTKEKVEVCSFELLAYRQLVNPDAKPDTKNPDNQLPDYFVSADDILPKAHVDVQAAAQKWIDSSISKTANVPTDFSYDGFKDIYMHAYDEGLKGCTTFRFNPEVFQGVLVKDADLANTEYSFTLDDGSVVKLMGNEEVEYDGEMHTAANLYDALKEGYYGKL